MTNQYMQEEDDAILKTYNRYPVVLDHGGENHSSQC